MRSLRNRQLSPDKLPLMQAEEETMVHVTEEGRPMPGLHRR